MTSEEDPELRDIVAQTLENNGVLSQIRAQLRASVFLALEEQELVQDKIPFINTSLKEFLHTSEGCLVACLVREFLEYFELDFTLSVFDPETFRGKEYDYGGRNKLIKDLKIKNLNGKKGPLLAQILQLVQVPQKDNSTTVSKEEPVKPDESKDEDLFSSLDRTPVASKSLKDPMEGKLLNLWNASQLKATVPRVDDIGSGDSAKPIAPPPVQEKKTKESSALTLLGNLPPLPSFSPQPKEVKALLNGLDMPENNYDEDFHSSASGSAVGKSDSDDIEEDIGSGVDDLLSNASGLEDLTVDATISNLSGLGDYMENV